MIFFLFADIFRPSASDQQNSSDQEAEDFQKVARPWTTEERTLQLEKFIKIMSKRPQDRTIIHGDDLNSRDKEVRTIFKFTHILYLSPFVCVTYCLR